jgi:2-polyprenyl-3-methyl-5-hydroxy-6-metoxy-1,4-benzoquinol methylase
MPVTERAFVDAYLPAAPARVLEVGCGRGQFALELARRGYEVTAIDPAAPAGDIFQSVSIEEFGDPGPFDAVIATRVLHHIPDLGAALDKIAGLLPSGGRLIVTELAWERVDEPTARWYLDQLPASHPDASHSAQGFLADWDDEHAGLHTSEWMCRQLRERFETRHFVLTPDMYRLHADGRNAQEEQRLIDSGAIQPTGFRYVGERP